MRTRVVRRWSAWGVLAATLLLVVPRASAGGTNTTCTETEFAYLVSGGGSVVFTQDCSITLSEPVPVNLITTIDAQGHNVTLSGGNLVQIFRVATGAQLTGIGLTLTGGLGTNGGALFVDSGAILVLTNCTVTGNSAMGTNGVAGAPGATNTANGIGGNGGNGTPGAAAAGGALYNFGSVMLLNCTFTSNNVTGGDGGAGGAGGSEVTEGGNGGTGGNGATAYGGAIYNGYNLTLTNCTFSGNTAGAGAGGSGGAAGSGVFTGLAGNGGAGGSAGGAGIWNAQNLTMAACTFSVNQVQGGNSAAGGSQVNGVGTTGARGGDASGGGLHSGWWGRIVNCTFYNNTVIGGTGGDGGPGSGTLPEGGNGGNGGNGNGGGLDNAGTLGVTNCTIANCSAIGGTNGAAGSGAYPGSPGNVGSANGGGIANVSGTLNLANSILATNLAGANAFGTIVAGGYDLSSDYTPSSLTSTNRNKDPLLGSLANNGGPTQTIALRSTNSPAYAQIPAGTPGLPPIDQRGAPRPGPGKPRADMGAYELLTSPGIAQDPSSVVQTNTGTVTFSVSAAGDSLYYLWHYAPTNFYYGTNVLSGVATNYPVSTSSNLTLSSITITNVGNYWVDVTNRYGLDTSTAATLSMPPFIAAQPTNIETGVGADATFQVIAASDQPLTYQWYLNQTNALATQTNWFYKLTNAQLTDDGSTYSVVVTNTLGSITSVVATLTVDSPPEILVNPTNRTVVQGTDIHFLVAASGTQPLAYQWRFNGNPKAGYTTTDCPVYGARTNNAGNYDVVITNRFGSVTSAPPAVLKVQGPLPINGPKLVAKSLLFTFQTLAGLTYTVEYKNRLTDTNWTALVNYAGTDGIISASDPATNQPGRFYRVRVH